jgi:hypothetical protein
VTNITGIDEREMVTAPIVLDITDRLLSAAGGQALKLFQDDITPRGR